jgi:hypothetical protein
MNSLWIGRVVHEAYKHIYKGGNNEVMLESPDWGEEKSIVLKVQIETENRVSQIFK